MDKVGPIVANASLADESGLSRNPVLVVGIHWLIHYRCGQGYMCGCSDFPDEVWSASEFLDCAIRCCFKGFVCSYELFVVEDHPFSQVVGFKVVAHTVICGYLFR